MIDSDIAPLSNIPPNTTTSPPSPAEPPKEIKESEVSLPTSVLGKTSLTTPSERAPSHSTPQSSSTGPSAGAIRPKHSLSGDPEIRESEIGPVNAEEYPLEEEEDELLSDKGDGEQEEGRRP